MIYTVYMWDIYMGSWTQFICLNLINISYFNKKSTWCFFFFFNIKHIQKFLLTSPHLMEDWVQHLFLWNCNSKLRKSTMLQWWQVMLDFWLEQEFSAGSVLRGEGVVANWASMLCLHWLSHLRPSHCGLESICFHLTRNLPKRGLLSGCLC